MLIGYSAAILQIPCIRSRDSGPATRLSISASRRANCVLVRRTAPLLNGHGARGILKVSRRPRPQFLHFRIRRSSGACFKPSGSAHGLFILASHLVLLFLIILCRLKTAYRASVFYLLYLKVRIIGTTPVYIPLRSAHASSEKIDSF